MPPQETRYRPGRKGTVPTVSVRTWIDARTLGKLALVACLLKVRHGGRPGLGAACALLLGQTFRQIVRGATDDELEAAVLLLPRAFPVTQQAWTYGRDAVRQRLSPRESTGNDDIPTDSPHGH